MPAVQRSGDANSAGGRAISNIRSVLVNGRPIVAGVCKVTPHPCCGQDGCNSHCSASTVPRGISVSAEGKSIILTGFTDTCGHARVGGSPNVIIGR
jgi:uncharacterized Zn-binding protein involved in type VI secretion